MSYQPFYIAGLKSGLVKNPDAFLIPQDAFPTLENAYVWRDKLKRKLGYQLIGRLRRDLTAQALGNSGAAPWSFNIYTLLGITGEPNAQIAFRDAANPLSIDIGGGAEIFIENPAIAGALLRNGAPSASTIDYQTGDVTLANTGVGVAATITFTYYPDLPVMGLRSREINSINLEDLIAFDTKYAYRYNGVSNLFEEWIPGTTWVGSDSDFFWTTNYWEDASNVKLFWETNNNAGGGAGTNDPIRYTNGTAWTNFLPAVSSTCPVRESLPPGIVAPWMAFGPVAVANLPIIPGTVKVEIQDIAAGTITSVLTDNSNGVLATITVGRADTGTVNYTTGAIALTVSAALTADANVLVSYCYPSTFMHQCLAILPFKDRLLCFNTWEGATLDTSVNFPQRVRWSQNGDPTDQVSGWLSDISGRGGFLDAPTAEHLVSVAYLRDIIIVYFERSTWQLRYTGNEILPFVFEKIDTELGCESTFSTVQFDQGVMAIGQYGQHMCDGNHVKRTDMAIPDEVLSFSNSNQGQQRVYGIRDHVLQLAYWTYSSDGEKTYPDRILVYNYATGTYSIWADHFTCFGNWYSDIIYRWQDLTMAWENWPHPWNWALRQFRTPRPIAGNQQGYVFLLNERVVNDRTLKIQNISGGPPGRITSHDHNLSTNDFVRLRNIVGDPPAEGLNDRIYLVEVVDADNFDIYEWNGSVFAPAGTGTYVANGEIELCNSFRMVSKAFNIYETGMKAMLGHIDFLADSTTNGSITCQILVDENDSIPVNSTTFGLPSDPSNFFNGIVDTSPPQFQPPNAPRYWHRFYCNTDGTTYQFFLTLNAAQISDPSIYESEVVVPAIILWTKDGGRLT